MDRDQCRHDSAVHRAGVGAELSVSLARHEWDDEVHRAAIHAAFDAWFRAHYQHGAGHHERSLKSTLCRLTKSAEERRLAWVEGNEIRRRQGQALLTFIAVA